MARTTKRYSMPSPRIDRNPGLVGLLFLAAGVVFAGVNTLLPGERLDDRQVATVEQRIAHLDLNPLALTHVDGRLEAVIVAVIDCDGCSTPDLTVLSPMIAEARQAGIDLGYLALARGMAGTPAAAVLSCALGTGLTGLSGANTLALLGQTVEDLRAIRQYWIDRDAQDGGENTAALLAAEEEIEAPLFAMAVRLGLSPRAALRCLRDTEVRVRIDLARRALVPGGEPAVLVDLAVGGSALVAVDGALARLRQ
ncbi:MAG: hypothetical protein AAF899_17480 [Pseudomonadota bacterium]